MLILQVFRVMAPNDKQFALKRVSMTNMNKEVRQQYREEVEMLRRLHWSEAVVTMHHFQEFKKEQVLFVVLECGECDVKGLLESKKLTDVVHNDGTTTPRSRCDPFVEHPNFICCLWQDMLRVVQVLPDETYSVLLMGVTTSQVLLSTVQQENGYDFAASHCALWLGCKTMFGAGCA